jgi:hypothetical protein
MQRLERELEGARKKNKSKISPVFSNIFIELKKREIVAIAEVSGPVVQFSATWYLDGKVVSEQGFGSSNTFRLSPRRSGRYSVTVHLQTPDGKVATSRSTDSVFFNRLGLVFPRGVKL